MKTHLYLNSLQKFGIHLGLERVNCLLDQLGNPQTKFKSFHIAGTNGKGTVAATIASILKEQGYRVGLYTSPHLFEFNERIKVNGKDISNKDLLEGLRRVKRASEGAEEQPTVFEVLTALAFWYFAKKKVDFAVVEVGMGGRLDATNVITPLVSVITNIDYEHTEVLGKTLSKIAREKGGIIKSKVPVVTMETKKEPLLVLKNICQKRKAKLITAKNENQSCALAAVKASGIKVSKKAVKEGLKKVKWPGRFQILSKNPLLIIDGAHNPAGAKRLRVFLAKQPLTIIFGMQKTKNIKKTIQILKPLAQKFIFVRSTHPNAAPLSRVTVKQALKKAKGDTLVCGSLFVVADAMKYLKTNRR